MRVKVLRLGIVLFVLVYSFLVVSVDAASMWSRAYGGADDEWACSVIETADGGYAMAGTTKSFGAGGYDFWLVKTDSNGAAQWNRTYGGAGNDLACSVVATSDGGYALAGTWNDSRAYGMGYYYGDFWLVKTDASGNVQWNKTYGGAGLDKASSLIKTADGGYALAGTWNYVDTWNYNYFTGGDFWLVKTDEFGDMQWDKKYGGTGNDVACSVVAAPDGGYTIAGTWNYTTYYGLSYYGDSWLVKTDTLGNMLWNKTHGETADNMGEYATSLASTSDGGYALTGTFNYWMSWLLKTDANGNKQWNQTYAEFPYGFTLSATVVTSNGSYTIASRTSQGIWLAKTDANGNIQWEQTIAGESGHAPEQDPTNSLTSTSDGGYAIASNTWSFGAGSDDFWFVKTDENGIVPEYASLLVPALVLTATALVLISKKRLLRKR